MFPRNDPCPCGSGRKYKKCCDGVITIDPHAIFRAERRTPGYIAGMAAAIDRELKRRADGVAPT